MTSISNSDDIIDSRDVIARIEELQSVREGLEDALTEARDASDALEGDEGATQGARDAAHEKYSEAELVLNEWLDSDERLELDALEALAEEAEGCASDWRHGEALIRDSYFEDYARELAEDIGAISADAMWPNNCLDWKQAARELQMDYTEVDFDGVSYWVR